MAKMKMPLAICLALALVFGSFSVGWAEGPGGYSTGSGPTDGGDGHPWDDGTTEDTPPDDGEDNPLQAIEEPLDLSIALASQRGFVGWIERAMVSIWHKVRDTKSSQKEAVQTNVILKNTRRAK